MRGLVDTQEELSLMASFPEILTKFALCKSVYDKTILVTALFFHQ